MYRVIWESSVEKDLAKLDRLTAKKIKDRVENFLVKNPTELGKPLTGNLKGLWSYRFSKYRVLYQVREAELLIIVVEAGHRGEIYR
jgi:mRNA interferase RelE/StbE